MKQTPDPADLRERALRLLARREHSRAELERKLETAGFAREEIGVLLDEFEEKKWLSDQRFAESWIADHRAKYGNLKLAYELRLRGVSDALVESILSNHRDDEIDRALEAWGKKFRSPPINETEKGKQARFLQSRGFTTEVIRKTLRNNR